MAIGAVNTLSSKWVPPVGAIITTSSSVSPAADYAGTSWVQIKDRFLMGAGGSYTLGSTGGSASHTLSVAEMPAHNHSGSITATGNHTHTVSSLGGTSQGVYYAGSSKGWMDTATKTTSSAGAHTHSVTIGSSGNGQAFSILNPYVGKYVWRRVS